MKPKTAVKLAPAKRRTFLSSTSKYNNQKAIPERVQRFQPEALLIKWPCQSLHYKDLVLGALIIRIGFLFKEDYKGFNPG